MNSRWQMNCVQRKMCELLRVDAIKDHNYDLNNDELLECAVIHEVAGAIVHNRLQSVMRENCSLDCLPLKWYTIYQETQTRISGYMKELDYIAEQLNQHNIPLIALKNCGIARGIYPYPGAVSMGDVDVLVRKSDFLRAHEILIQNNYHFEFRSPLERADVASAELNGGAEYWKLLPNGEKLWFELQWRPVSGRWLRPDQEPSADELMERSIPIQGTALRLLAPEDNLLQVALHTAKHSYVRAPGFRLHLDVDRIVRAYPQLDWELFLRQVKILQVNTAVYFSLLIPYDLFGTPIPNAVLDATRPSMWKEQTIIRYLNRVSLFDPLKRKFDKVGYIFFNSMLYDNPSGLLRSIFPKGSWMRQRYGFNNNLLLPYYHGRRLIDITLRRVNT
jgi:hypothetical protein